ncbi:MAG: c-type cytochrome [Pseudomonadota bacterium]
MRTLVTVIVLAVIGAISGAAVIYLGLYNVAATQAHHPAVYWVLEKALRASVRQRSEDVVVPALNESAMLQRGLQLFKAHCVQCHGAPGVAPDAFALGLNPPAANLAHTARVWPAAELFWVIKHGVRTTGMPAWAFRLADEDIWAVTSFVQALPRLSPKEYQAMAAQARPASAAPQSSNPLADPVRGRIALSQYACVTCHVIPDVAGATVPVGPPLTGMAQRKIIAGMLPNTPENMMRWLREPQKINPGTAMPDLGVTQRDAADMTAYLYTLR